MDITASERELKIAVPLCIFYTFHAYALFDYNVSFIVSVLSVMSFSFTAPPDKLECGRPLACTNSRQETHAIS